MSLWIVGCCPCCNEEDTFSKIEKQLHFYGITNYIKESLSSQKKWTFFKIAITPRNKNTNISLRTRDIVSEEYIRNKKNKKGDVNNIDENEFYIIKKIKDHKLNAYIVGYSDVDFVVGKIGGNTNNNNINKVNNNEEGPKKYYYVLIKDITTKANAYKVYEPLFSALEQTAGNNNFTYSIEIIAANTTKIANMCCMFNGYGSLTEIVGLDKWNTTNVTNMSEMFNGCKALTKIKGLDKWNTTNVTNMSWMFYGCYKLKSLPDISKWDTSNVKNMSYMFSDCSSLKELPNISKWDTSNVTNMSGMFNSCKNLESLPDISNWDTSNVTNMSYMFMNCSSLKELPNISKWDTSNKNMNWMFSGCKSLKEINFDEWKNVNMCTTILKQRNPITIKISKWNDKIKKILKQDYGNSSITLDVSDLDLSKIETNMSKMFEGCKAITEIVGLDKWDTDHVKDMNGMFSGCGNLVIKISKWNKGIKEMLSQDYGENSSITLDVSDLDLSKIETNMKDMFSGCKAITEIVGLDKWETDHVKDMNGMFSGCGNLVIKISKWNKGINEMLSQDYGEDSLITLDVSDLDLSKNGENMNGMFSRCKAITKIVGLDKWDTSNVKNMGRMFNWCEKLVEIKGLEELKTDNVTNMSGMFINCRSLKQLPNIFNWNTSNVTDMRGMFSGCKNLESLPDISKWNTNKVTDMSYMFCGCNKLKSLPNISEWDTKNVMNMEGMFYECNSLESLPDISKWNTSNVTDIKWMFSGCSSLESLPEISKWNTKKVTNMSCMFEECTRLKNIPNKFN